MTAIGEIPPSKILKTRTTALDAGGRPKQRRRDEHDRLIYEDREIPPPDASAVKMAVWRGNVITSWPPTPGNSVSGCHPKDRYTRPYAVCTRGWVRSGRWWLHCSDCHASDMDHYDAELQAFRSERDPERWWTRAGELRRGSQILWLGATEPSPVLSVRRRGQQVEVRHRDPDGETYTRIWAVNRPVPTVRTPR